MEECEYLKDCILNKKLKDMPETLDLFKYIYCRGDRKKCARYRVATSAGKNDLPDDLFPTQNERADEIIARQRIEDNSR